MYVLASVADDFFSLVSILDMYPVQYSNTKTNHRNLRLYRYLDILASLLYIPGTSWTVTSWTVVFYR